MSLPLVLKKSLRDNEAKRDEHLDNIKEYFSFSERPTLEVTDAQWLELNGAVEDSYKNRGGEIIYDWVLGGLAWGLKKAFTEGWHKSTNCRDAFGQNWSTKKIKINLLKTKPKDSYHVVTVESGVLVITSSGDVIATNVDSIACEPSVMETVKVLYNGIDYRYQFTLDNGAEEKIQTALTTLSEKLGSTLKYEMDWATFGPAIAKASSDQQWNFRAPDLLAEICEGILYKFNLDDEMVKEAIKEKWTTGIITAKVDPTIEKRFNRSYHATDFVDGKLVVFLKDAANLGYCGEDIEERL
jgi:hypothetical protein